MKSQLEIGEMPEMAMESVLATHAGLDAAGVAELRGRLAGSQLWLGCEGLLKFKPSALLNSVTAERRRARAMLQTEAARSHFDALIRESFALIQFDVKARRAVFVMAHLVCMLRDLCELQAIHGPLPVTE
jgi:hypothetical protein